MKINFWTATASDRSPQQPFGSRIAASKVRSRPLFSGGRSRVASCLSGLLALCMVWSFAVAPSAIAAHLPKSYEPKPHSAWMSPTLAAKMKAQAQHVQKMQRHAQAHLYPYKQVSQVQRPAPALNGVAFHLPVPLTHLNDAGQMAYAIPQTQITAWSQELASARLSPARAARLHLWLGEWQLAYSRQPETALAHFQAAQRLTQPQDPLYGTAAYDRAFVFYSEGAYRDAVSAFSHVLNIQPRLQGFDRRDAALWLRHAGACAGYHADRERAGIPEPPRLDPLCGAASLASSLRALGCPADKNFLRATMHITGEGSSLQDIVATAQHLGLHTRVLRADDQGLMLLPKPLVAYVEHDHFVSVIRADKKGVSYLCSDCGPWPGGRVDLTWQQWHLLEGGLYVSTALADTPTDRLLSHLDPAPLPFIAPLALPEPVLNLTASPRAAAPLVRLAFAGDLSTLHLSLCLAAWRPQPASVGVSFSALASNLRRHVVLQNNGSQAVCGSGFGNSPQCLWSVCCQTAGAGPDASSNTSPSSTSSHQMAPAEAGPTEGDPVNLATGQEGYSPKADLEIYNPHGPSVTWSRSYESLRRPGQGFYEPNESGGFGLGVFDYEMNDFGEGWSRSYNIGVSDQYPGNIGTSYPKSVFFENGSRIQFVLPSLPTAAMPQVQCQLTIGGVPLLIYANYSATLTGNLYYRIVFSDRIQWITGAASTVSDGQSNNSIYPLAQLVDRNGNAITFHYGPAAGGITAGTPYQWPLLSTITNNDGTALLTVVRANDGMSSIAAVYDCYGRSVLYHTSAYVTHSGADNISGLPLGTVLYGKLDHVSQLVPTGTGTAPDRYIYGYQNVGYGYSFLHTISVPNPSGQTAMSTATINYDNGDGFVTSLVDANGNTTSFTSVAVSNSTTGGGGNPGSSSAPSGTLTTTPATGTNYTQVTVANGAISYSYVGGCDMNMSGALMTDGTGRITSSKVFSASSADPYRPTSQTDGNGNTSQYVYDTFGNLHQKTNPRGIVTNYTYAFPSGQVSGVVNSAVATGAGFGLGEKVSEQEGTKTATQYTYYEPSGLIKSISSPVPGTVGSGQQVTSSFTYDGLGNFLTITTPGNNAVASNVLTFNYTTDGSYTQSAAIGQALTITNNLGKVQHQRFDPRRNRISKVDELGNETDVQYNIADQPVLDVFPATNQTGTGQASITTSWLYLGGPRMQIIRKDESGNPVRQDTYTYGPESEQLSVTGSKQPTFFTYDALYRPKTVANSNGGATTYSYNSRGYVSKINYATGDSMQFPSQDSNGNVLQSIDGRGIVTNYVYNDPESSLTDIQYPSASALNVHLAYDSYGRPASMTDGTGASAFTYDDVNKKLSVATTYTSLPAQTVAYQYYPDGSRQNMSTPAGKFTYSYDGAGRQVQLANPFGETTSKSYFDNSWLASQDNGIFTAAFKRNARGLVTDCAYQTDGLSSTLLSDFGNIQYDAVGNLNSVTVSIPSAPNFGGTSTYQYDSKNQLTAEQSAGAGGYSNGFVYDASGNPTTIRNSSGNTFNSSDQVTNPGFVYDGNGNPTTYNGTGITFDVQNRLTQYGNVMTAGYRGDNLRAWKQTVAGRTYFLYDDTHPVCELSATGAVSATNTFVSGALVSRRVGATSTFYTFDVHGSVAQRIDSSRNVLSSQVVDAYGKRQSTDNNTDPYCGFGGQLGNYTDFETGLVLMTFRYYDPAFSRFLTRDPAGVAGGVNLYEYANNSPISQQDPLGLDSGDDNGGGGFFGGFDTGLAACLATLATNLSSADPTVCVDAVHCIVDFASGLVEALMAKVFGAAPFSLQGVALDLLAGAAVGAISALAGCIGEMMCNACEIKDSKQLFCEIGKCIVAALIGAVYGVIEALCNLLKLPWMVAACKLAIELAFGAGEGSGVSLIPNPVHCGNKEVPLPMWEKWRTIQRKQVFGRPLLA